MSQEQIEQRPAIVLSEKQAIPGTEFYKMWKIGTQANYKAQVPIFNVYNMHGLNSIVGYVMLTNSEVGQVLYRGQAKLYCGNDGSYNDLLPSICHIHPYTNETKTDAKKRWNKEIRERALALDKRIAAIIHDPSLIKQIGYNFNPKDIEMNAEIHVVVESLLQHYGDSTRCMDFVDNHWIALWFGLYQFFSEKAGPMLPEECFYKKRTLKVSRKTREDSQSEMRQSFFNELERTVGTTPIAHAKQAVNKLLKKYTHKLAFAEDEFLYILLFVANTSPEHDATHHAGVYSSSQMTVVDLRRALPSVFLRPGAQHGWTVRMNSNKCTFSRGDYSFAKNVVAILRIPLSLADELIGGALLSQENLFPPEDYDQGYRILLRRQEMAIHKSAGLTDLDIAFKCLPIKKFI